MAVVALAGPASPVLLVPIAVVLGGGQGLFLPGNFAIVPTLANDADLQASNGLVMGVSQMSNFVGPALGGAIVGIGGAGVGFGIDAFTFVISVLTLYRIRERSAAAIGNQHGGSEEDGDSGRKATFRSLLRSARVLQVLLVLMIVSNLGSGAMGEIALPVLVRDIFHGTAADYGVIVAVMGGGAIVGTLVAGQLRAVARPAFVSVAAYSVAAVAVTLVPYLAGTLGAGALLAVFGFVSAIGGVVVITAIQRWARADMRGRVMALMMLGISGVFPVSVLVGGVLVRQIGASAVFLVGGLTLLIVEVASLSQREWRQFGVTRVPMAESCDTDSVVHCTEP